MLLQDSTPESGVHASTMVHELDAAHLYGRTEAQLADLPQLGLPSPFGWRHKAFPRLEGAQHVSPERLRWARDRARLDVASLTQRFPYPLCTVQPTLKQLERVAKATHAPIGAFFLAEPLEEPLPLPDYRTLGGRRRALTSLTRSIFASGGRIGIASSLNWNAWIPRVYSVLRPSKAASRALPGRLASGLRSPDPAWEDALRLFRTHRQWRASDGERHRWQQHPPRIRRSFADSPSRTTSRLSSSSTAPRQGRADVHLGARARTHLLGPVCAFGCRPRLGALAPDRDLVQSCRCRVAATGIPWRTASCRRGSGGRNEASRKTLQGQLARRAVPFAGCRRDFARCLRSRHASELRRFASAARGGGDFQRCASATIWPRPARWRRTSFAEC